MKTKIVFGAAVAAFVSAAALPVAITSAFALDYQPAKIAQLQGLDKITARISTFEVPVGQAVKFGTLSIRVDACYRTPPEERPESASFLEITDLRDSVDNNVANNADSSTGGDVDGVDDELFSGWMFASSPGLSALEHPVYDVWVKECLNSGDAPPSDGSEQGQAAPAE